MRAKILISTFIFFLTIELSCGSDETCKRDCSKAVRNNLVTIESLIQTPEDTVTCGNTATSLRRKVRFKTYTKDEEGKEIPRGYIRVTPKLDDGVGGGWISTEFDQEEHNEIGRRGIITKSSDFCSDSCGVVEIEYGVKCPGASSEQMQSSINLEVNAGSSATTYKTKVIQPKLTN